MVSAAKAPSLSRVEMGRHRANAIARTAAQTLTTNAYTTILFDTVTTNGCYDSSNGYNAATGQYTIPVSGYYTMDAIINDVMGGGEVARQLVGPSATGYNKNLEPYPYDMAKAKQLIRDSGQAGAAVTVWNHDRC